MNSELAFAALLLDALRWYVSTISSKILRIDYCHEKVLILM